MRAANELKRNADGQVVLLISDNELSRGRDGSYATKGHVENLLADITSGLGDVVTTEELNAVIANEVLRANIADDALEDTLNTAITTAVNAFRNEMETTLLAPLWAALAATQSELVTHKDRDVARWQEFYDMKAQFLDLQAGIANKVIEFTDEAQWTDIEAVAQGSQYVVSNTLGGRIKWEDVIVLLDLIPGEILINGVSVWNSQGLGLGSVGDYADVNHGDIIECSGITKLLYVNYVAK